MRTFTDFLHQRPSPEESLQLAHVDDWRTLAPIAVQLRDAGRERHNQPNGARRVVAALCVRPRRRAQRNEQSNDHRDSSEHGVSSGSGTVRLGPDDGGPSRSRTMVSGA
jgi:hypothetical protein